MVKGTLDRLQSKNNKSKRKKDNNESSAAAVTAVTPTSIQLRMWPAMLESFQSQESNKADTATNTHNIYGIAPTGTGKTLSYALPIVTHCVSRQLCQKRDNDGQPHKGVFVHGLVLAPTRELAIQISKEFKVVAKTANKILSKCCEEMHQLSVQALAIYGGVDIDSQISSFSLDQSEYDSERSIVSKFLIVASTPGRLQDLLNKDNNTTIISAFENLQSIVFDEADRIAMNPEMTSQVDDILELLNKCRKQKIVSCLVSATLPDKAKEICDRWVPRSRIVVKIDSIKITKDEPSAKHADAASDKDIDISSKMEATKTHKRHINIDLASIPSHLVQTCHVCANYKKPKKLILTLSRLYKNPANIKSTGRFTANNRLCIVFFAQIKTVKYTCKLLQKEGIKCIELYGSLHQTEREKRLQDFRAGKVPILLATDVAARGIHINNVHYVVNYDFPGSLDQYVHRCGRAGRKQLLSGEDVSSNPPIVYSFFTREFAAMADSLIELLRSCNATIDPNLLALSLSSNKNQDAAKSTKKRKRKPATKSEEPGNKDDDDAAEDEEDKDEFPFLGKSVLKRASHVSDAESSDSESE
ncbi:hypothetical protein ACHAWC_006996 [Mediolabrus comicus]